VAFGFASATVFNGCDYAFRSNETLDIECPSTNKLIVVAGSCEIQIGTQTGLKSLAFKNGTEDFTIQAGIEGIKYTVTKDGFLCPFAGTGEKTGKYTQSSAVTVQSPSGTTISVDPEVPPPPGVFTASSYPTTVTATSALGNGYFNTEAGAMECAAHFEGSYTEASTTLTITPTYTSCRAFGFVSATINLNGCDYVFHGNGEVDLACPAGKAILIAAGNCEATIGAQSGLKSISLKNNGNHIDAQASIKGIKYTVTKDGFLCPFAGTGEKTGGEYIQNEAVTVKPVSGGTSISIDN